jgi:predicted nucleotidyltransferase
VPAFEVVEMTFGQLPAGIRGILRELRSGLQGLYGDRLVSVYVYGSYARGTFRETSDIDVLVVLKGTIRPGAEITRMGPVVSKVCLDHNALVSVVPVADEEYRSGRQPFLSNVRMEAVAV